MGKKHKILWLLPVMLLCAMIAIGGCSGKTVWKQYQKQYFEYFDTYTDVTIYAKNEEQAEAYFELVDTELKRYHRLFDIYHNYDGINNIKTINDNAGIAPIKVDVELIELLQFSKSMYEQTDGLMNVAMGSVLSIWHNYRTEAAQYDNFEELPSMHALEQANVYTDLSLVEVDENAMTVYLPQREMKLDVGAVAKGYATARLCERLREAGVEKALLSVGGNVQTIGVRDNGEPWRVGIQNPDLKARKAYLHALDLEDMALVTSGTYQRYYEVDGVRYHHIIDPNTLMPKNEYLSVTILHPDGGVADALSTAVFNMKLEVGKAYIEAMEQTEALWVLADGTEVASSGFSAFVID